MNPTVFEAMTKCGLSHQLVSRTRGDTDRIIQLLRAHRITTSFAVHQHLGDAEALYLSDNSRQALVEAGLLTPEGELSIAGDVLLASSNTPPSVADEPLPAQIIRTFAERYLQITDVKFDGTAEWEYPGEPAGHQLLTPERFQRLLDGEEHQKGAFLFGGYVLYPVTAALASQTKDGHPLDVERPAWLLEVTIEIPATRWDPPDGDVATVGVFLSLTDVFTEIVRIGMGHHEAAIHEAAHFAELEETESSA